MEASKYNREEIRGPEGVFRAGFARFRAGFARFRAGFASGFALVSRGFAGFRRCATGSRMVSRGFARRFRTVSHYFRVSYFTVYRPSTLDVYVVGLRPKKLTVDTARARGARAERFDVYKLFFV